jgi:hypothetical protein
VRKKYACEAVPERGYRTVEQHGERARRSESRRQADRQPAVGVVMLRRRGPRGGGLGGARDKADDAASDELRAAVQAPIHMALGREMHDSPDAVARDCLDRRRVADVAAHEFESLRSGQPVGIAKIAGVRERVKTDNRPVRSGL